MEEHLRINPDPFPEGFSSTKYLILEFKPASGGIIKNRVPLTFNSEYIV